MCMPFKSGFLRASPKSGGGVSGPSPIRPKLSSVSPLDPKSTMAGIILIFGLIKVDFEGILSKN